MQDNNNYANINVTGTRLEMHQRRVNITGTRRETLASQGAPGD